VESFRREPIDRVIIRSCQPATWRLRSDGLRFVAVGLGQSPELALMNGMLVRAPA